MLCYRPFSSKLFLAIAFALALLSVSASAKQVEDKSSPCTAAIPVTVTVSDGRAVTPLTSAAFEARVHGRPASITALDQDDTPKRIVLVLDASRNVNAEAWKMETSLASFLANGVPSRVSLALVVLNSDAPALDFTTSRETLRSTLADLASIRPANAREGENIYQALVSDLRLFGTRQFGDAMFAFLGGSDDSGRIDAGEIRRRFIEQGVRVFGFVLGQRALSGFYMLKPGGSGPAEIPWDPDTDEIGGIAAATGGLLAVENTRMPSVTYHLSDERLKQLQTTTYRLYTHIVTPYRIQISANALTKPENLSIELSKATQTQVPNARILFPRQLIPCAAVSAR